MPNIGSIHPIVVHFVIALLVAGVVFRLLSLTGKLRFAGPAATSLLVVGALLAILAAKSGDDAHSPVERIPGVREMVEEHEEWGERTRNLFLLIAGLELTALFVARPKYRQAVLIASGVLGVGGLFFVYETGEHGGELVYSYAGGVGIRTGEPADVSRLLLAGLYHQAMRDREEGRLHDAARLIDEMARRRPADPEIGLLLVESRLLDRQDPDGALLLLGQVGGTIGEERRMRHRMDLLRADAYMALGRPDSARAVLEVLLGDFPDDTRILQQLEALR